MFIFSMSDGNAHLRNRWFYVWFWKQSSVWDPSPHFHMSHNKMQSPRSTQWAGNSSCWVNLQPIVIPFAAMLVAPKRFLSGRALQLMLQGYGEICRDSGPWISLCLFNSWLLFIHLLGYFFFLIMQMLEEKYLVLDFCFGYPGKKTCGGYFMTVFLTFTQENWEGNLHFKL